MKIFNVNFGMCLGMACAAFATGAMAAETKSDDTRRKPGFVKVEWSEAGGETWTVQGLADRESGRPMTKDTVFAICSNTKPIASVLALTFVEDGTLDLDDPVAKYFPRFAEIKLNGRPPKKPILLRHLLTHLSGLQYGVAAEGRKMDRTTYLEKVDLAVDKGLRSEPGEAYHYCGLGFQIMAAVIEKVSGRKIPDLLKERVLDPLEMRETTFYPDEAMLARAAIPYYYPPKGGDPVRYDFDNRWTPPLGDRTRTALLSGGLMSTVGDYLKFSQMIVRKGVGPNGRRVLSERMFDEYLFKRQTPPGDKADASFDIGFNKDHTGGGKGGLFATGASWNWSNRTCVITFRAKSPYAPKGAASKIDTTGFDGKKTTFTLTDVKVGTGEVSCQVGNNEDRHGAVTLKLKVDGRLIGARRVELAIGESKRVAFACNAKPDARVEFATGPVRVLMVGNSFSKSVLQQMPDVCADLGLELDLCAPFIGGCPLERHWKNWQRGAQGDFRPYAVTRYVNGKKVLDKAKMNLPEAVKLASWDVITFQQASPLSWKPETYRPFAADLQAAIRAEQPAAEFVWQETWSYTPFNKSLDAWKLTPETMYEKIHAAYAANAGAQRVIPMGTAVQEWRRRRPVVFAPDSLGGDVCGGVKFTRRDDGTVETKGDTIHLNAKGCYLQALVWTAKLYGVDIGACTYRPKGVTAAEAGQMKRIVADVLSKSIAE